MWSIPLSSWVAVVKWADESEFSDIQSKATYWNEIYAKAFPNHISVTDMAHTHADINCGIDKLIVMPNGKTIRVDEKVRRRDYGDIAIETISNDKTGALGWIEKDLLCDYIAYVFIDTGRVFLLPFIQLKNAWRDNKSVWIAEYGTKTAKNLDYFSHFVCVPIAVLFKALGEQLRLSFLL